VWTKKLVRANMVGF